jgi:hypothetical protein
MIESDSKAFRDLRRGLCPACQAELVPGSKGGAAQNFFCTDRELCRSGFNLTLWQGTLVVADEIGEVSDDVYAMYTGTPR